jgi:transcriptional regulator with XRE-family HTH domain
MDFAQQLRALMAERGVSGNALASRVHCDKALISRFVNGRQRPSAKLAALLDEALGAGGVLVRAASAPGAAAADPGGVLAAFGVARASAPAAGAARPVAPELVDYFRSQLAGHYRADMFLGPHHLIPTVIEQHRLICDLAAMAADGVRAGLLRAGTAYAALIGWLHQDAGDIPQSVYWRSVTLDMAHRCGDPDLISYALTNKAMLLTDTGSGRAVIDFGRAAMLGDPRRLLPKTRIMAAVQSAHGHALTGQRRECDQLLDAAARLARQVDDEHVWGNACNRTPGWVEVQRATCYGRLGADQEAASLWGQVLGGMSGSARRDTAVFRTRHAAALAVTGEPEQAGHIAGDVVALARETGSARLRGELLALRDRMSPWAGTAAGRELAGKFAEAGL